MKNEAEASQRVLNLRCVAKIGTYCCKARIKQIQSEFNQNKIHSEASQ